MEAQLTAVGGARHGTNAYTGTYGGVFRLRLDSRTRHRIRERERGELEMFENWQPFWDVLILVSTFGILTLWLYIKGELDD